MNDTKMKEYIGTKLIRSRPCLASEASEMLGRKIETKNADEQGNGYLVEYDNEKYLSWSPAVLHENAYKLNGELSFGMANDFAKKGYKIIRKGWNGTGMHVEWEFIDEKSKNTHPYLVIIVPGCTEGTRRLPWQPAQVDLFQEDWSIVFEPESDGPVG